MPFIERAIVLFVVCALMAALYWITPVFWKPFSAMLIVGVLVATVIGLLNAAPKPYDRPSFWS